MLNTILKKYSCFNADTGLMVLRFGIALVFIFSGLMKVLHMDNTVSMFGMMGIAAIWAYVVSVIELVGGLAILLGVWTRMSAFALSIVMIVAIVIIRKDPNMIVLPLMVLFSTISLICSGSGKYSIMRMCKCGKCSTCVDKKGTCNTCTDCADCSGGNDCECGCIKKETVLEEAAPEVI